MSVKWNPKRKIRQSYREVGRSYFVFGYSFYYRSEIYRVYNRGTFSLSGFLREKMLYYI